MNNRRKVFFSDIYVNYNLKFKDASDKNIAHRKRFQFSSLSIQKKNTKKLEILYSVSNYI